jgi:2-polyprenyl-3-methyl-5-hydroxy-6-metoxy-1,4-benzoquinol methylase|tara:strand:- start:829 stop:1770 length:942 start_codon:yes stop_codon:yes gene_type:complete
MNSQMIRQLEFDKKDIHEKKITLRDGRDATLLVHEPTGHGILDSEFWVKEDFYSEQYRDEFSADSDGERKKSEEHFHIYKELNDRQFNLFKDRLTSQTKYLEIGCAHGGIVSRVNDFGVEECHVVEPNIKDSNFVKYKNPNAIVYNSTFDDVDLQEDYFDIIVAFDVVEHLYNPKDFLKKCFDLLNKNGILLIAIPNHNDVLLSKYDCNAYQKFYYHKAHINYFTTQSIVNLCQSVGFAGYVDSFLDYSFFNNVHWQQNNKPMSSADKAFISDVTKDDDINEFYKRVEREYEDLINSKMLGGALIYTGVKENV